MQTAKVADCLKKLLGQVNVAVDGERIFIKPADAGEVLVVLQLAAKEKIAVEAPHYTIGKTLNHASGKRFVLSLERMNRVINFDRESFCVHVEPAATVGGIEELLAGENLIFPAKKCRNERWTIGENVAVCFAGGEPDFRCLNACLCGLEMVLFTGEAVTLGGSCVREVHNYDLSYLLSGYTGETAVITGIHLKIMPPETFHTVLLVLFNQFDDVLRSLSLLFAQLERCGEIVAVESGYFSLEENFFKRYLSPSGEKGVYVMFNIRGVSAAGVESIAQEIAAVCLANDAGEVLAAEAPQQREEILAGCGSLITDLRKQKNVYEKSGIEPLDLAAVARKLKHRDSIYRLKVVTRQNPLEGLKLFYLA
ncbi:MAG: FAD-binding oxidoreductase [Peptococcaceae bacterium]|nr:MAG: FAD-binding oxidoreductase [Peptococcaceae bacterium]